MRRVEYMIGPHDFTTLKAEQKTAVVDDAVKVFPASRIVPTDPLVPRPQPPGRRAKTNHAQHTLGAADQIAQLRPAQPIAQGMKLLEQLPTLPGSSAMPAAHQNQFHRADLRQVTTNGRQLHPRLGSAAFSPPAKPRGWGQLKQARTFQPLQGNPRVGRLESPRGTFPIQPLAKLTGQSAPRQIAPLLTQARDQSRTEFSPADNHLATMNQ